MVFELAKILIKLYLKFKTIIESDPFKEIDSFLSLEP